MVPKPPKAEILDVQVADDNNVVSQISGGGGNFVKEPCVQCPWMKENDGSFPAEAFRISAYTAYDMSDHTFGCHMTGTDNPSTCAGFLLRNSEHNLAVRLKLAYHKWDPSEMREPDPSRGGLHDSYREMAIANGVDPDDPVLKECRP